MFHGQKWKKRYKKIAAILALLLIASLILGAFLPFFASGAERDGFDIKGEIGFNNKYKIGGTTPINVEITNNTKDFDGEIQLKILKQDYGNTLDYIIYSREIKIPEGATKRVSMNIDTINMQRNFEVVLVSGNKEVSQKKIFATPFSPEEGFLGVLSEDTESINYIKNLGIDSTRTKIIGNRFIELEDYSFPEDLGILENFEVIVINNYDTTRLNREQNEAISRWIHNGGMLILGTGINASKVLKGIDSNIINATHQGTYKVSDFEYMEVLSGVKFEPTIPLEVADLNINDGEGILFSEGKPISTLVRKGQGSIVIHHFDLGLNPMAQWDGNRYMLTELYMNYIPTFFQTGDINGTYQRKYTYFNPYTLRLFPHPQQNGLLIFVTILLLIYIFVAGPILYLILKTKDKREYGWLIIPIIAIGFSTVIYLLSSKTSFRYPISSSIGLVTINPGETLGTIDHTLGIFIPNTGEAKITLDRDIKAKVGMMNGSNHYGYDRGDGTKKKEVISAKIQTGEKDQFTFYNQQSWTMNSIIGSQSIEFEGPITSSLVFKDNKLVGTIENKMGFALETCILVAGNNYYFIDTIKNNEIATIEKEIVSKPQNRYQAVDSIFGRTYDTKNLEEVWGKKLSKEEIQRIVQRRQIFQNYNDYYDTKGYTIPQPVALQNISGMFLGETDANTPIMLYGFSEKPFLKDIEVNGDEINGYSQNLFTIPLGLDYSKMENIEIPYGFIKPYITSNAGFYIDDYDQSIYMHGSGRLDIVFTTDTDINLNEFQIQFNKSPNVDSAQIYNYKTGAWEELSSLTYKEDTSSYISMEGTIQIGLDISIDNQKGENVEIPKFRMKGDKY
ncbi:MAG: tripartite tricarboxylate transporter TctB family protein [Epulopiscium sp.]|nr:tripartite tricarboxylate transporter TctB family protein [Candidatus Epulonipiscium sp.]